MSIDLSIPGDPGAIRHVADWLAPRIRKAVFEASDALSLLEKDSVAMWKGESGNAFRIAAGTLQYAGSGLPDFAQDAAEVFRAYANRLEDGRETFDKLMGEAEAFGLDVDRSRRIVQNPTWDELTCPADDAPKADREKWEKHLFLQGVYNDLAILVGEFWGQLEAWLVEHMAPLVERVAEFGKLHELLASLKVGNEHVVELALEHTDQRARDDLRIWREVHDSMQTRADDFTRGLRSGNPALRAASEAANPRAMREGLEALGDSIGKLDKLTKVVPGVGTVLDVILTGSAIAGGDSPSSAVVELVGGSAGGAGAAGLTTLLGGPPAWAAGAAVGGGIVVGGVSRWAYEGSVPFDVRETIDGYFDSKPSLAKRVLF